MRRNIYWLVSAATVLMVVSASAVVFAQHGLYGFNVLLRRGGSFWVPINADDPRLSDSMRLALSPTPPLAQPGNLVWREVGPGFEVGELPVLANGAEVDRILLSRIDPARYRFVVRNAPAGTTDLRQWMHELGAAVVINGSYYSPRGEPDTPFLSDGRLFGPSEYRAVHGAFVASDTSTTIQDLGSEDWRAAFAGAHDALVSYPLLVAPDGSSRVTEGSRWLANRSFVAVDRNGRIILGTTANAFFSLDRLARFLRDSPINVATALNLDGGPVACQSVAVGDYRRDFYGHWEMQDNQGRLSLLSWNWGGWALPVVLAAVPK